MRGGILIAKVKAFRKGLLQETGTSAHVVTRVWESSKNKREDWRRRTSAWIEIASKAWAGNLEEGNTRI